MVTLCKNFVKAIEWLLSDDNPSVKYWTLKGLLDKPENDAQVQESQRLIAQQSTVKKILSSQDEKGFWGTPTKLWGYQNTVFQLLLLSELGFKRNSRIEKAVEFTFDFQSNDGSFASVLKGKKKSKNEFCLTGIILKCLLLLGYNDTDSRVNKAVTFLTSTEDDGWSCNWYPMEKDKVIPEKCYMGGIKVLAAFSKLPPSMVTGKVKDIILRNAEPYLENRIYWYRKDKNGKRTKKPSWARFAFPLFWQSDALDVLDVLTELGVRDERMGEALDLVKSKQVEGRWVLERTYPKNVTTLEEVGKPSKWITLRALRVLKRAGT